MKTAAQILQERGRTCGTLMDEDLRVCPLGAIYLKHFFPQEIPSMIDLDVIYTFGTEEVWNVMDEKQRELCEDVFLLAEEILGYEISRTPYWYGQAYETIYSWNDADFIIGVGGRQQMDPDRTREILETMQRLGL